MVSLASGIFFYDGVADRLLESESRGEQQFVEFVRKNLLSQKPDVFSAIGLTVNLTFTSQSLHVFVIQNVFQ